MPKMINNKALEVGDIVLTTTNDFDSKLVRTGTKTDISHAMICVARSSVIDSTGNGVHARNIQKMFYDDNCAIHIMRLKETLTDENKRTLVEYLRLVIGTPYSLKEAVKSITPQTKLGSELQFCSRLAARSYVKIGVNITNNPDYCTPADIKNSDLFYKVDTPFIYITEQQKHDIESNGTTVSAMQESINSLLNKIRLICPNAKILDINDIFLTLLSDYELDSLFAKAFEESGYLDRWQDEPNKYPWRYDYNKLIEYAEKHPFAIQDVIDYCNDTIQDHANGTFDHWKRNKEEYNKAYQAFHLKTLELNANIYEKLWSLHTVRVEVANEFLRNR